LIALAMVIKTCIFFLRHLFIKYFFFYIMYICAQILLPYFHVTSKVEFFFPILKIDSYLIWRSDKKSWHAQTSWMTKKKFLNGKNSLERKNSIFLFSEALSKFRKIYDRLKIMFINNMMLWLWLFLCLFINKKLLFLNGFFV